MAKLMESSNLHITIRTKLYVPVLLAVLFLTALNGLYNSLNVEYGGRFTTFLFLPPDRHADLIEVALSFPPFNTGYDKARDGVYEKFYLNNAYKGIDGLQRGELTALHEPPFMVVCYLILKKLIVTFGSPHVVSGYYILAFFLLAMFLVRYQVTPWEGVLAFVVLGLSSPFLFILSRGNIGALITTAGLMCFLYEVLLGRGWLAASLWFALAVDCRPNVVLLLPLFLVFGLRGFLKGIVATGLTVVLISVLSYIVCIHFYPGYRLSVFFEALETYYKNVVLLDGSVFTAYGVVQPLLLFCGFSPGEYAHAVRVALVVIGLLVEAGILLFSLSYLRRQIDKYEFAFALSVLFIWGSTVLNPYHIFFLFAFLLTLCRPSFTSRLKQTHHVILWASVFVLVPKTYLWLFYTSFPEAMANTVIMSGALVWIWCNRASAPRLKPFWKGFIWNPDCSSLEPSN